MKLSHFSSIIFAIALVAGAQAQTTDARPRTASISGRVTIGAAPAANALVIMMEERGTGLGADAKALPNGAVRARVFAKARTDGEGRYRIPGLPAGRYTVRALSAAYVAPAGQKDNGSQHSVTIEDGAALEGIDFNLVRGAVITGRVTDAEGRPRITAGVYLLPVNEQGDPVEPSSALNPYDWETDDRGMYRIYGLPSGRYLIAAGADRQGGQITSQTPVTFHPDTTNRSQAKPISVKEGDLVENIDIRLGARQKRYEAAGHVIDAESGRPLSGIRLQCLPVGGDQNALDLGSRVGVSDEQGRFRIAGLVSGHYEIRYGEFQMSSEAYYIESAAFEVNEADATEIEVKALRGVTVSGIVVPVGVTNAADKAQLQQTLLNITVIGAPGQQAVADWASLLRYQNIVRIGADGSFRASGLPPGKLQFGVLGAQSEGRAPFTLNRIERGGVPVSQGIEIHPTESINDLRVVMEYSVGVIRGQIKITAGTLPANRTLDVMAVRKQETAISAPTASGYSRIDQTGHFLIERLPPGEYEVHLRLNTPTTKDLVSEVLARQTVLVSNAGEPAAVAFSVALPRQNEGRKP